MSAGRPSVPEGIGQKTQFLEMKLELKSHKAAEFSTDDNIFDIRIRSPNPIKTTFKLIQYKDGKETELPGGVFTQTQGDEIIFHLALPEPAWYKFNIFAMPRENQGASLPNVYTYLIDLTKAKKPVRPYPKQFADWNMGCYLYKPLFLDTSEDLNKVEFKVLVPGAKRVAVKAGDEWTHLKHQGGNLWEGDVSLQQYRNKNVTVNLNACTGDDETQFATLLQYTV